MGSGSTLEVWTGQHRIKKMGEMNPERFSCELEVLTEASNAHGRPASAERGSVHRFWKCILSGRRLQIVL